mmetsp:Transcript_54022/g.94229  ORF Transcript_54022/g.94229 Transcript_54022/m.94229 type:complete len:393 (-) Transcript_54022:79-1257(-)
MTELLDVFDDEAVDRETVSFLVEALDNAESSEWADLLEPFLPPARALAVLSSSPGVLERTREALEKEAAEAAAEAAKPPPNSDSELLDSFVLAPSEKKDDQPDKDASLSKGPIAIEQSFAGLLGFATVSGLMKCSYLCRRACSLVMADAVWEPRVRALCKTWQLECPDDASEDAGSWRRRFLGILRPRCDGIYVGECRYVHRVRPGTSIEAKLMNKSSFWIEYRRYVRLLPPVANEKTNGVEFRALVLRDPCTIPVAEEAFLTLDTRTHVNSLEHKKEQGQIAQARVGGDSKAILRDRVCMGTYTWAGSMVEVRYGIGEDTYKISLELMHGGEQSCSGRLEWREYSKTSDSEEALPFHLGRSKWGGAEPENHEKDHFPAMLIKPSKRLEHLF